MSVDRVYVLALRSSKEDCRQRVRAGVEIRKMYSCYIAGIWITRRQFWSNKCLRENHQRRIVVEALRSCVRAGVEISSRGLWTEITCRRWDLQQGIVDRDYVPAFDFYQLVLSARVWNCVGGLLLIRHKADICRKYLRCHKTGFIHQKVIFCYIKSIQMH